MAGIDTEHLAQMIYYGKVNNTELPDGIYHFNADQLMTAVFKGYGTNFVEAEYNSPDYATLRALKDNVYMFSAAKTFQQTREMTALLVQPDGKTITPYQEFRDQVAKISDQYNANWLRTEYDTAIAASQQVSAWERIEREREILPMLTYVTIGDACDICAPLNGTTLPATDPFWNALYPPNHFNCRCLTTQHAEDDVMQTKESVASKRENQVTSLMDDTFKLNVGKLQEVFSKEHPYFIVPEEFQAFAKENFGLPIPTPEQIKVAPEKPAIPEKKKTEPRVVKPKVVKQENPDYSNVKWQIKSPDFLVRDGIAYDTDTLTQYAASNMEQWMKLAGIPSKIEGELSVKAYKWTNDAITQFQVSFKGDGVVMQSMVNFTTRTVNNELFKITKESKWKGRGAEIFNNQVQALAESGKFDKIGTMAARADGQYNGYYTWARLGYNFDISKLDEQDRIQINHFFNKFTTNTGAKANTLNEIMATDPGRKLWKKDGFSFWGEFDLQPNSQSRSMLKAYIDAKYGSQ